MPRKAQRKTHRVRGTKSSRDVMVERLTSGPSYLGNKLITLKLPGAQQILTNTVTTGLLATSYSINPPGAITGWSARFASTFDEWRLERMSFEIIPVGLNVGVTAFFFSENSISVTLTEANERPASWIKNNEQKPKNLIMKWVNQDYTDASFRNVTTNFNLAYFYAYTDASNLGSPIVATNLFIIRPIYTIQFRGIAST